MQQITEFPKNTDDTTLNRAQLIRFLSDAVEFFCHGKATVGLQAAKAIHRLSYARMRPLLGGIETRFSINKRLER